MKRCTTCKQEKQLTEFNKNRCKKDGLNTLCKTCSQERSRRYYKENRDKHLKVVLARKKLVINKNRKYLWDWLIKHPCVDCGENDPVVLDFDHLGDKELEVSVAARKAWSLKRLKKEIDKCEIRCSNCHRRKTAKEGKWKILEYLESR